MESPKVKGPNTKLLECAGLIVRVISKDPSTENLAFEVFPTNEEGIISNLEPIFKATETTPSTNNALEKCFTSPENRQFNLVVLNNDKDNKELDETPFMEIAKTKDNKESVFQVSAKEKAEEEPIGTIECNMKSFRIQFKINGSDTTYHIDEKKHNKFSFECLLCCGRGSGFYGDELSIYESEKSSESKLDDPSKKLSGQAFLEPVGKITKLKRPVGYVKLQDTLISFPKGSYNEERSLLLALTFLMAARFFK